MQLQTISVKELRNNFPKIIKRLAKGTDYLNYISKRLTHINPVTSSSQKGLKKLIELRQSFSFKSKKSAVQLIREERD